MNEKDEQTTNEKRRELLQATHTHREREREKKS